MTVFSFESDFADRHYKWFGGRKHFGYLIKMAKMYGVQRCEEIISSMKNDTDKEGMTADYKLPTSAKVKYFHKIITSGK